MDSTTAIRIVFVLFIVALSAFFSFNNGLLGASVPSASLLRAAKKEGFEEAAGAATTATKDIYPDVVQLYRDIAGRLPTDAELTDGAAMGLDLLRAKLLLAAASAAPTTTTTTTTNPGPPGPAPADGVVADPAPAAPTVAPPSPPSPVVTQVTPTNIAAPPPPQPTTTPPAATTTSVNVAQVVAQMYRSVFKGRDPGADELIYYVGVYEQKGDAYTREVMVAASKSIASGADNMVLLQGQDWTLPQRRPPICLPAPGQACSVSPMMTQTALIGTLLEDAVDTQVGSIMPKFQYTQESDSGQL